MAESTEPHSLEAERALLGAVLVRETALEEIAAVVRPEDFWRDGHRRIYRAMLGLQATGHPVDFVLLREALARGGDLDEAGGPAYLASLVDGMPASANVGHYAGLVREKARLRGIMMAAQRLLADAASEAESAAHLASGGADVLAALADGQPGSGLVEAREAMAAYVRSLDDEPGGRVVPTGYADLDVLAPLRTGDYAIVAARPSVGKTAWVLGAAWRMATAGHPTLLLSLETGAAAIARRLIAMRARVSALRLARGQIHGDETIRVLDVAQQTVPLWIETSAETVAAVDAWTRRAVRAHGIRCVIVDYLQLLLPERRRESVEAEIAGICRGLKRLATRHNVLVLALSQLSRAPEHRRDKRPHLADLRGSGALEQDCDVALLLYREELYDPTPANRGIAELIVAKNRDGPTGVTRLAFVAELTAFEDLAWERA